MPQILNNVSFFQNGFMKYLWYFVGWRSA